MQITNELNIPLYLAAWLLQDTYDYVDNPKYLSATTLLKPMKEVILSKRLDSLDLSTDLSSMISRGLGSSLHDAVEKSWTEPKRLENALRLMGYSIDDFAINEKNPGNKIPVFLEQRRTKDLLGYKIGGKFDFVFNGMLHDLKTTSAYSWIYNDRDDDYRLQGSIYRWLNPDIITEDKIRITFIFTDWQASQARSNPSYPQSRIQIKEIDLLSERETEIWIKQRIALYDKEKDLPEDLITPCSAKEMWFSEPVWKYYGNDKADPNTTRATKNFTDPVEAYKYAADKGKGKIVEFIGEPKKCMQYCSAFLLCKQGQSYYGDLDEL